MVLMPDGRTLCVANGGILTHPESGRAKLNLDSMKPSIVLIDINDGSLIARFEPPPTLSRLSLRHLAVGKDAKVWFGAQWEGNDMDTPPLIGHAGPDRGLVFAPLNEQTLSKLGNYVGSVAANGDGSQIAFTSPFGGHAVIVDATTGKVASVIEQKKICGVTGRMSGFVFSSELGQMSGRQFPVAWDNHMQHLRTGA